MCCGLSAPDRMPLGVVVIEPAGDDLAAQDGGHMLKDTVELCRGIKQHRNVAGQLTGQGRFDRGVHGKSALEQSRRRGASCEPSHADACTPGYGRVDRNQRDRDRASVCLPTSH